MTKKQLKLENARLRGQIDVLRDELQLARATKAAEVVPYVPVYPSVYPVMPSPWWQIQPGPYYVGDFPNTAPTITCGSDTFMSVDGVPSTYTGGQQ